MRGYEHKFSQVKPNVIASDSGHTIEILGRAGLRVGLGDRVIEIDSEMLNPPMSIVIYASSIPESMSVSTSEILDEVTRALEWSGFSVDVIK